MSAVVEMVRINQDSLGSHKKCMQVVALINGIW
jgi:hypothetical protein